jgi:putative hemolysin
MKASHFAFVVLTVAGLALAACAPIPPATSAAPQAVDTVAPQLTAAPTGSPGIANPASENCVRQGGTLSIATRPDGGQYGVCSFEDNRQCEEWALLRGECPVGGVKVTGYTTDAAIFCAISGGTYEATANAGQANEEGTCALPGGGKCDAAAYYAGACPATGNSTGEPQPATTTAATLRPPSAEVCNGMAQVMMQALPGVEVTQASAPVEVNDPAKGASGTGCRAFATGTGETFKNPTDTVQAISGVLAQGGWQEDMNLLADGPTGTATGYRSGDLVCLVGAIWKPDPAANCPTDKPIFECKLTPSQQLYEVTVDCATSAAR